MNISRLKFGVLAALLLVGVAVFVNQRVAQTRLARENAALRRELQKLAQFAAENDKSSKVLADQQTSLAGQNDLTSELLRLRGEVALVRRQVEDARALQEKNRQALVTQATNQAASAAGTALEAPTADYWPRGSWQFRGYATPDDALETQFYAASRGDLTNFLASLTDKMKEMVEKDMAGKSDTEIAAKLDEELKGLQSVRVLGRQLNPDDTAVLTVDIEGSKPTSHLQMLLKKIGSDWKLAEVIHK